MVVNASSYGGYEYNPETFLKSIPLGSYNFAFPLLSVLYLVGLEPSMSFMSKRDSWTWIKPAVRLYNLGQVAANCYMVWYALIDTSFVGSMYDNLCGSKELVGTREYQKLIFLGYLWCLLKVSDFLDTYFFIALKKFSHVSFLHVYHHSTTMLVAFVVFRYLRVEQAVAYAGVNCIVHVVMYSYYFLTSMGARPRWKRMVTTLQLTQFLLLMGMTFALVTTCQTKTRYIAFSLYSLGQCGMYIYLFGKFYLKTYNNKKLA